MHILFHAFDSPKILHKPFLALPWHSYMSCSLGLATGSQTLPECQKLHRTPTAAVSSLTQIHNKYTKKNKTAQTTIT